MSVIRSGQITAFFLFDVAESVDLDRLRRCSAAAEPARLRSKPAMPSYVRYQAPPLQIDGESLGSRHLDGFQVRVKVFDYGVVSLSLSRAFSGTLGRADRDGHRLSAENALEAGAERLCREVVDRIRPALDRAARAVSLGGLFRLLDQRVRSTPLSADELVAERRPRHRAAAARRDAAARAAGARRGAAAPHLLPRRRPRRADVEQRARLRHRGRRAGDARDLRVRRTRSCCSSATTTSCSNGRLARRSTRSWRPASATTAGGRAATPAPRARCTRCSSTSTS